MATKNKTPLRQCTGCREMKSKKEMIRVLKTPENEIVLDTDMGLLTVRGKELHVKRLTLEKGELDLEGQVDSLNYSSNAALKRSGDSFLNRLFK